MAAADPANPQPGSAQRAVPGDRHRGVLAAGWIKPAARAEQRADKPPIPADHDQKHAGDRTGRDGVRRFRGPRHDAHRNTRSSAESRSRASSADVAPAAGGSARTTNREPLGRVARRSRTTCRSRRFTRFRVTASPTARLTTKPARGSAAASSDAGTSRWTTRRARPTRRPCQTAAAKSGRRRSREGAGNTSESEIGLGGQRLAALAATSREDGAPGAGAHAQPETMRLRAAAIVRLERALAHGRAPGEVGLEKFGGLTTTAAKPGGTGERRRRRQVIRTYHGTWGTQARSNRPTGSELHAAIKRRPG